MKTQANINDTYSTIKLPEIVIWIVGVVVFISLIYGCHLNAQHVKFRELDTLWLKSGEVIPCNVGGRINTAVISVQYADPLGSIIFYQYPKKQVWKIKRGKEVVFINNTYLKAAPRRLKFYVSLGIGAPLSCGISGTLIFKNTLGVSIGVRQFLLKSKNAPGDYSSLIRPGPPRNILLTYSACFLKEFYSGNRNIRFGLEAGPSLVRYSEVRFIPNEYWLSFNNYNVSYITNPLTIGVTLRLKSAFEISRTFGIELALISNINKYRSVLGAELYIDMGRVKDKKRR